MTNSQLWGAMAPPTSFLRWETPQCKTWEVMVCPPSSASSSTGKFWAHLLDPNPIHGEQRLVERLVVYGSLSLLNRGCTPNLRPVLSSSTPESKAKKGYFNVGSFSARVMRAIMSNEAFDPKWDWEAIHELKILAARHKSTPAALAVQLWDHVLQVGYDRLALLAGGFKAPIYASAALEAAPGELITERLRKSMQVTEPSEAQGAGSIISPTPWSW